MRHQVLGDAQKYYKAVQTEETRFKDAAAKAERDKLRQAKACNSDKSMQLAASSTSLNNFYETDGTFTTGVTRLAA